ncbi:MAG: flagellar basal-body rod protein FlgF [Gammaproteobacteria bacterium]|nr:flagellar basal-body rod protein FlgF [Gammaproteobacteria bacterium]
MDRMIYLAMSAAKQTMTAQALATHNLANANTTGFKADFEAFRAMPMAGPGYASRAFALIERPGTNFAHGSIETTGNQLDVAVNGDGFIAVLTADGTEAYTRAGDLQLTVNGQLQTGTGLPVLGNGGPIALPQSQAIVIGVDGTISIRPLGQEANTLAQIDRIKLVKPDLRQLIKSGDGLLRLRDGANLPADGSVRLTAGALEGSNVNVVQQMVNMIKHARAYEMAVKAMNTAQQMDAAGARLLNLGG